MSGSEKIHKFLLKTKVFYLSTIDGDKPRCRPLGAQHYENDKLYFAVGDFKNVYKQLLKNPNCELVAYDGEKSWLRLNGKAVFEKDFVLAEKMMAKSPQIKEAYEKNGWKSMVFHIEGTCEIIEMMKTVDKFQV